jgi:hypothetical protein
MSIGEDAIGQKATDYPVAENKLCTKVVSKLGRATPPENLEVAANSAELEATINGGIQRKSIARWCLRVRSDERLGRGII